MVWKGGRAREGYGVGKYESFVSYFHDKVEKRESREAPSINYPIYAKKLLHAFTLLLF